MIGVNIEGFSQRKTWLCRESIQRCASAIRFWPIEQAVCRLPPFASSGLPRRWIRVQTRVPPCSEAAGKAGLRGKGLKRCAPLWGRPKATTCISLYIDAMYYYIVDYDLDGLIDVGSTTRIEALDRPNRTPIGHVIEFFSRSTKRGEQFQANLQKMYDEGIQIALKYFGE